MTFGGWLLISRLLQIDQHSHKTTAIIIPFTVHILTHVHDTTAGGLHTEKIITVIDSSK